MKCAKPCTFRDLCLSYLLSAHVVRVGDEGPLGDPAPDGQQLRLEAFPEGGQHGVLAADAAAARAAAAAGVAARGCAAGQAGLLLAVDHPFDAADVGLEGNWGKFKTSK